MEDKKILHLTVTHQWFDLMVQGIKKVEYREIKMYWLKRLAKDTLPVGHPDKFIKFDEIHIRNGYRKDSPFAVFKHVKTDLTPPKLIRYTKDIALHLKSSSYQIHLGELLTIKNYKF